MRLPLLADVRQAAEHCSYCPKMCRFACPVASVTGKESVTPWGIDREITAAVHSGAVDAATAAAVYACTGCRACGGACLPGLDLPTHVRAARAAVVDAGLSPPGVQAAAGHPTGPAPALHRGATPGAATIVYSGCRGGDDAHAEGLVRLLAAAGVDFDVVSEPTCCGARSADVGLYDQAQRQAEDLAPRLLEATTVVVSDPHCARWLRVDREDPRVVTWPAFAAGTLLEQLRFDAPATRVAWHDPCWLGRGMGEYEAPRTLLAAAGSALDEPEHTRDRARCTGGGMGFAETSPEAAEAMLGDRARELAGTGTVVSGCPTAVARLRQAGLDAHDLAGWLAGRLGRKETR